MLRLLAEFDPDTVSKLHANDRRRIIRAFEVYYTTGKTKTDQNELSHLTESDLDPLVIGITYENRELLYERINKRVDIMLKNGLLNEAEAVYKMADTKGGFQAIGHKELFGYFKGETDLETATEHLKMQTRRYAKRQLTWFRRDSRINWIFADKENDATGTACDLVKEFIKE